MENLRSINSILESISFFPLEDQQMIAEIIRKRVIEQEREILANHISESMHEYTKGKTKSGSLDDFLNDIEEE